MIRSVSRMGLAPEPMLTSTAARSSIAPEPLHQPSRAQPHRQARFRLRCRRPMRHRCGLCRYRARLIPGSVSGAGRPRLGAALTRDLRPLSPISWAEPSGNAVGPIAAAPSPASPLVQAAGVSPHPNRMCLDFGAVFLRGSGRYELSHLPVVFSFTTADS